MNLHTLPSELLLHVLAYLGPKDILNFSTSNRHCYSIVKRDKNYIRNQYYDRHVQKQVDRRVVGSEKKMKNDVFWKQCLKDIHFGDDNCVYYVMYHGDVVHIDDYMYPVGSSSIFLLQIVHSYFGRYLYLVNRNFSMIEESFYPQLNDISTKISFEMTGADSIVTTSLFKDCGLAFEGIVADIESMMKFYYRNEGELPVSNYSHLYEFSLLLTKVSMRDLEQALVDSNILYEKDVCYHKLVDDKVLRLNFYYRYCHM